MKRIQRIDWLHDQITLRCVVLVSMGFSPKVVGLREGLTVGQVCYRCRQAGIKCTDYRCMKQGTRAGSVARTVLNGTHVERQIKGYFPKKEIKGVLKQTIRR